MGDKALYDHLPIPTYEEATSSRPTSSQSRSGPEEISDDAERQGLLYEAPRTSRYEPPSVESVRTSLDSLDGIEHNREDEVRREMQQMDMEDPLNSDSPNRSLLASRFTKRFSSFTNSFSSLHIPPFRQWFPRISLPHIDMEEIASNRAIIIGRVFGILLIMGVVYVLVASDLISFSRNRMSMGQMYDPESIRAYIQRHMNDHGNMQECLRHITEFPHVAGTEGNYVLGEWVSELFKASELEDVNMERFDVYLNYPREDGRKVAIIEPEKLKWEATIEEDEEDTFVFHGHSKTGDVKGPLVYANYGSREDFATLDKRGIAVKGAVVLVRYYGSQGDRALKVKAAEEAGAVGCIIFSDPINEAGGEPSEEHPNRYLPADGVQRGAVSLMSWIVGDVLSPGWPSTPGDKHRLKVEESSALNKIPSLPLSWRDASHLLGALKGHGQKIDGDWQGVKDVEYWTGDKTSPVVNLKNEQDEETYQPIYNVVGKITGWEQPNKRVIVGNHRDAWCMGASDPGSGTAVMLEVIRIFGMLRRLGWRPLRTIEFASWDGEEYNLIGSTEHVENRMDELRRDGIAYLNVDVAVAGTEFHAAASPMMHRVLMEAIGRVGHPTGDFTVKGIWEKNSTRLEGLGAGSDYVAFQDMAGTSSIDLSFRGARFPYHSCYDSYEYMEQYGDPDWSYHRAMGEIWALMILELADKPVLPLDVHAYSLAIPQYIDRLEKDIGAANSKVNKLDLKPLRDASETMRQQVEQFTVFDMDWNAQVMARGGFESQMWTLKRIARNNRLADFETKLLDLREGGGLAGRTQFKHMIFAPQKWSGYDEAFFPGVRDAVEDGNADEAQHQVQKVADFISTAARSLNEE